MHFDSLDSVVQLFSPALMEAVSKAPTLHLSHAGADGSSWRFDSSSDAVRWSLLQGAEDASLD